MYYQLPNGKVIQMSLEEYFNMTDKDIQYLLSVNAGDYISNPFSGASIGKTVESFEDLEKTDEFYEELFPEDYENLDNLTFDDLSLDE